MLREVNGSTKLNHVSNNRYKKSKEKILALNYLLGQNDDLNEREREALVASILDNGLDKQSSSTAGAWVINKAKGFFGSFMGADSPPTRVVDVPRMILEDHDKVFLSHLGRIADNWPILAEVATRVVELARDHFRDAVKKEAKTLQMKILSLQRKECQELITRKIDSGKQRRLEELRVTLLAAFKSSNCSHSTTRYVNEDYV